MANQDESDDVEVQKVAELQAKVLANQTLVEKAIAEAKRAVASAASDARVFGEGS
eukprot:COSAG01_NODE_51415_length_355_cov_0.605469_1_plen_54_part_10